MFKFRPSHLLSGRRSYDATAHLQIVRELHAKYELNTKEKCEDWSVKTAGVICKGQPQLWHKPTVIAVHRIFSDSIYEYSAPTLEDREYLTAKQAALSPERISSATGVIVDI